MYVHTPPCVCMAPVVAFSELKFEKVLKKKMKQSKKEEMSKTKKSGDGDAVEKDLGWGSRFKPRKPRRIRQFNKKSKDEKSETGGKSDDLTSSQQKNTTGEDQDTLVLCRYAKGPDDTIGFQLLRVSVQE